MFLLIIVNVSLTFVNRPSKWKWSYHLTEDGAGWLLQLPLCATFSSTVSFSVLAYFSTTSQMRFLYRKRVSHSLIRYRPDFILWLVSNDIYATFK